MNKISKIFMIIGKTTNIIYCWNRKDSNDLEKGKNTKNKIKIKGNKVLDFSSTFVLKSNK